MNKKFKLSICMMVKDEEKNLNRCLNSIKELLDKSLAELIIVDTGSKDNTVEIAKEYTNKIYFHPWNNDFSGMRNKTMEYAKGEWIFILDADEKVDEVSKLEELLNSNKLNKYNTVIMQVKSLTELKKENKTALNPSPRLFKNDGEFKYVGTVHNQPVYKSPLLTTDITLTHYGYILSDRNLMNKKFNRTKKILEDELIKDPNNVYYQFQLGVTYDMHGDKKDSLREFKKAYNLLSNKSKKDKFDRIYIYGSYARSAFSNGKFNEAIEICYEGLEIRHEYLDLHYILGISLMQIGEIDKAIDVFLKYLDLIEGLYELDITKDVSISLYNVDEESKSNILNDLSWCYYEKSDYDKALIYIRQSKDNIYKTQMMVKILIGLGDYIKLKDYYLKELEEEKLKDLFIITLESELFKVNEDTKDKIHSVFADSEDKYGLLNIIRISEIETKVAAIKKLVSELDFDKDPIFYSEIFKHAMDVENNIRFITQQFKKIKTGALRNIIKYLIDRYPEIVDGFEKYLADENVRKNDLSGNRVYISIAAILLVRYLEQEEDISDEYLYIFEKYVEFGVNLVSELYNIDKVRVIYKEVSSDEERFFMLMLIVNDYISKGNIKSTIKYLTESISSYNFMVKYIDKYKDKLLLTLNEGE